ncbi:hypothetical protein [Bacillus subtilis]|uniref:Uncharacterized protein n=1 Tax=Bacillus subtilis subsp. subtilis TaxID=135461 RepID=A0ABD3ZRQ0_BACIU|nr:hypothetical protein [Bacillus subtilis]KIL30370.1 hypothetical protein B4067_1304 [Bacillus subtilis subsp. subtilis]KIN49280.1 hypothetical protein B4145_1244 [Bacillus subtilis]
MAKLEGVKTLDMVNGEITKVEYNCATYERVDGEAKAGDIGLRIDKPTSYATVGAFYQFVYDLGGLSFIDDVGDKPYVAGNHFAIFRKVAASTNPSVEERVAKAEGEIESLKSDVAALKGGAEYKRIAKSEARAGDYVKFDDPPSYLTDKEYYEIKEFYDGDPIIIDDDNDEYDTYAYNFEFYRKVSASSVETEPKPERLKVGDYAKVVREEFGHLFDTDDIIELIGVGNNPNFIARSLLDGEVWYVAASEVVRATDEEVAEAKDAVARAKFKRGDKVRLKSGGEKFPLSGFSDGGVYTVMYNDFNHLLGKRIRIADGTERFGYATPDQLEMLSEEEAAERKKWAEIGREVGEYKVGDIFRRNYDGDLFEITRIDDRLQYPIRFTDLTGDENGCKYEANLTLVTPVEARFDR